MGAYHAKLGPSGAFRWSVCTASIKAAHGIADDGNEAARVGTVKHGLSSEALEAGCEASEFMGREFLFGIDAEGGRHENFRELLGDVSRLKIEHVYKIDQEAVDHADAYVNYVRDLVEQTGGQLLVEKRVPIDFITGEGKWVDLFGNDVEAGTPDAVWEPAGGTADAIILTPDELIVIDAKFGFGKITAYEVVKPESRNVITGEIDPPVLEANTQLAMYGAGARHKYDPEGKVKRVRLIVVQPPLNHLSEFAMPVERLDAQMEVLRQAANATRDNPVYAPDADRCHFCKAAPTCAAREELVLTTALEGISDVNDVAQLQNATLRVVQGNRLGTIFTLVPLIKSWCVEQEQKVYEALVAGDPVVRPDGIGHKLVAGKQSSREWKDEALVEKVMTETFRLSADVIYNKSLITPTQAEAKAKVRKPRKSKKSDVPAAQPPEAAIGPTQWGRLQELIAEQHAGKPVIALETDPRPAVAAAFAGFEDESTPDTAEDAVDFFN